MSDDQVNNGELIFADGVLSAEGLRGRLDGIRTVGVRRGAVVTPAARDLLRERKVELTYSTEATAGKSRKVPLAIGVANARYQPTELVRVLKNEPVAVRVIAAGGLIELIEELTKTVSSGATLGMLVTEDSAAALCLANRRNGIRAAGTSNRREACDAVKSIGANLLVINPIGRSLFEMKSLVAGFCTGWPRECPEIWRGRM